MSAGRVHELATEYDIDVRYTYFPLHPGTPPEGQSLGALFAGREALFADMSRRLETLMAQEGLEYGHRTHTYNSRLAQELAIAGDAAGVTDALHEGLFRAYFVDARNLATHEVLRDVGGAAGLDAGTLHAVLDERVNRAALDRQWNRARSIGVTGVPTFVANGLAVVGAQPYETLQALMKEAGVARRS